MPGLQHHFFCLHHYIVVEDFANPHISSANSQVRQTGIGLLSLQQFLYCDIWHVRYLFAP